MCMGVQRNSRIHVHVSDIVKNAWSRPIVSTQSLNPLNLTKGNESQTLVGQDGINLYRCSKSTKYEACVHVFCTGFIFVHDL